MRSPRLATLGCLVVSLMLASSVRADPFLAAPEGTSGAAHAAPRATASIITTEQLFYFAELVGEPRPVVWQRLQADPTLVPFAVAAADARRDRKSSGKVRTAVGFSIFGVGGITGYIVMLSALTVDCGYNYDYGYSSSSCDDRMGNRFLLGALIIAASAGLGLGIGIPGIVSMARQSETETAAVDRYQYPQMPVPAYAKVDSAWPGGYALRLPLLSLSF